MPDGVTATLATLALQNYRDLGYVHVMIQTTTLTEPAETEAERQSRLDWEADRIAEARASIAAGYYVTSAEVKAWIDSLGTDNPLPVPYPRHQRPR